MDPLFKQLLIWHVIIGLLGITFFVVVLLGLLKIHWQMRQLRIFSLLGLLSFLASWIMGGYYYVMYYGSAVKPIIKTGDYAWAHGIVMETKEHVFLFLPFLAAVVFLTLWFAGEAAVEARLRKPLIALTLLIVVFGVFMAAAGTIISGAVR